MKLVCFPEVLNLILKSKKRKKWNLCLCSKNRSVYLSNIDDVGWLVHDLLEDPLHDRLLAQRSLSDRNLSLESLEQHFAIVYFSLLQTTISGCILLMKFSLWKCTIRWNLINGSLEYPLGCYKPICTLGCFFLFEAYASLKFPIIVISASHLRLISFRIYNHGIIPLCTKLL